LAATLADWPALLTSVKRGDASASHQAPVLPGSLQGAKLTLFGVGKGFFIVTFEGLDNHGDISSRANAPGDLPQLAAGMRWIRGLRFGALSFDGPLNAALRRPRRQD